MTLTAPARPKVAMLLYPGLTVLDLIAPHAAFAGTMETHLVWKTLDPVPSDFGVAMHPTTTFTR
jgi:putative intracellular protease/amidase